MARIPLTHTHLDWLRAGLIQAGVIALAVAAAFSLPGAVQVVLYRWWPRIQADAGLLLATEIGLAALLTLLFNLLRQAVARHGRLHCAHLASLVYARIRSNWLSRWREQVLLRKMPAARDAFVLAVTGKDTFAAADNGFRSALQSAWEIRVMLLHPSSPGARQWLDGLPAGESGRTRLYRETRDSIDYLQSLRQQGKKVRLKFYEHPPFWKLVMLGEHVWVQYCQGGDDAASMPEYVFALNHQHPKRGLFIPFYMHFLESWSQPQAPELDFDSGELVYRDEAGIELRRQPLSLADAQEPCAVLQAQPVLKQAS